MRLRKAASETVRDGLDQSGNLAKQYIYSDCDTAMGATYGVMGPRFASAAKHHAVNRTGWAFSTTVCPVNGGHESPFVAHREET